VIRTPAEQVEKQIVHLIEHAQTPELAELVRERTALLASLLKLSGSKIHHTRGVYNSHTPEHPLYKDNGVPSSALLEHVVYNLFYRPGRAFFIDGKCVEPGYLGWKRCLELEKTMTWPTMTRDTRPYQ